jgi:hypothetical protein
LNRLLTVALVLKLTVIVLKEMVASSALPGGAFNDHFVPSLKDPLTAAFQVSGAAHAECAESTIVPRQAALRSR